MFELMLLAIALSMDGFAVSIGLGTQQAKTSIKTLFFVALYLGGFHFLMTLAGYYSGFHLFSWFETFSKWIAFALLLGLGLKTIVETLQESNKQQTQLFSHATMLVLAFAVSIDAFAAGLTLVLFEVTPFISCLIIGFVSFCFSLFGFFLGKKGGEYFQAKANIIGGIILILIGFRILLH